MQIGDHKWKKVKEQLKFGEDKGDFLFFAVGIEDANMFLHLFVHGEVFQFLSLIQPILQIL